MLLAAAAFSALALHPTNAGAAQAGVVSIEMKITGQKTGVFKGDSTRPGHQDEIVLSGYSFELVSPFDPATGQGTGRAQFKPVTVTKELGASSPQILGAAATNENLTSVVINFWRTERTGALINFYRVTLTDAWISDVKQYSAGDTVKEDVSFVYRKIKQEHLVAPQTSFEADFATAT
jgi:type VI secretion system secreted protein Hcp